MNKEKFFLNLILNYFNENDLSSIIKYNLLSSKVRKEFYEFFERKIEFPKSSSVNKTLFLNSLFYHSKLNDKIIIQAGIYNSLISEKIEFEEFEFENIDELIAFIDIKTSLYDIEPSLAVRASINSRVHLLDNKTPVAKKDFFEDVIIENLKNNPMNKENEIILKSEQLNWLFNKDIINKAFYKEDNQIKEIQKENFFEYFNYFDYNNDFYIEKQNFTNEQLQIIIDSLDYYDTLEKYEVEIVENLSKTISIKAESFEQAKEIVMETYNESRILLDSNDFAFTEFLNPKKYELNSEKIKGFLFSKDYPNNLKEIQILFSEFDTAEKNNFLEEIEEVLSSNAKKNKMSAEDIKNLIEKIKNDVLGISPSNLINNSFFREKDNNITLRFYNKKNMQFENNKIIGEELKKDDIIDFIKEYIREDESNRKLAIQINNSNEFFLSKNDLEKFVKENEEIFELEKLKNLSDIWAAELSKRTELSSGMTYTQIDEKQAEYYRNYESAAKKMGISVTPFIDSEKFSNTSSNNIDTFKNKIDPDANPLTSFGRDSSFTDTLFDDIENGVGDLWKSEKRLNTYEINQLISEDRIGNDFHFKVSKEEAEFLIKNDFIDNIMNKEYGDDDHWVGMTKDDLDEETNKFDDDYLTFEIFFFPATNSHIQSILKALDDFKKIQEVNNNQNENIEIIGGKIKDIAIEAIQNPESLSKYDQNTQDEFIIENLGLKNEQIKSYSDAMEFGNAEEYHPLSQEQLDKIPDYIDNNKLSLSEKYELAFGTLDYENEGLSYQIKENKILRTSLNEKLFPYQEFLKISQIKFNKQNPNIMKNSSENQEKDQQELQVGRIASVNTENGLFKGAIESFEGDNVNLTNLKGEKITAKKEEVYQFFHGQKFDYSELSKMIENSKELPEGLSIKDLKGNDIHNLLKGNISQELLQVEKKDKTMSAEFKLQPYYNSEHKEMEIKAIYKNPNELNFNIFGEKATEQQIEELKSGEKVTLERSSKSGKEYTAQVYLDKDLNQIIFEKFIDKAKEQTQTSSKTNSNKKEFKDQFEYEQFLSNEVNVFDNAKKINFYQLDAIILTLDQSELNEFLIDMEIEETQIDSIIQNPDPVKKTDTLDSIKNAILGVINSSAEKVDLFKEKFKSTKENQQQTFSTGKKI